MDKYSIKIMPRALRDLDAIYAYIARSLQEPTTALDLVTLIEQEILSLETMPYCYPTRKTGAYANKGYRQLLIKNYVVVYRVNKAQKAVIIVTVRYAPSRF